jgi:cytochrome c oxidase subunit 2
MIYVRCALVTGKPALKRNKYFKIKDTTIANLRIISRGGVKLWNGPALGIKADAYPGRLNQVSVLINREGVFYGQCSELCGVLHSSMPIVIESVSLEKFLS